MSNVNKYNGCILSLCWQKLYIATFQNVIHLTTFHVNFGQHSRGIWSWQHMQSNDLWLNFPLYIIFGENKIDTKTPICPTIIRQTLRNLMNPCMFEVCVAWWYRGQKQNTQWFRLHWQQFCYNFMQNSLPVLSVKQCPTPTLLTLQLWKSIDYGNTDVHADNQLQYSISWIPLCTVFSKKSVLKTGVMTDGNNTHF